jgi:hypothetical protein
MDARPAVVSHRRDHRHGRPLTGITTLHGAYAGLLRDA